LQNIKLKNTEIYEGIMEKGKTWNTPVFTFEAIKEEDLGQYALIKFICEMIN